MLIMSRACPGTLGNALVLRCDRYIVLLAAVLIVWGIASLATGVRTAIAQGAPQPRVVHNIDAYPYILWRETWAGGELLARSWSVYSGSMFAISGDIEAPGWRLRTTAGYGRYTYHKWRRGLDGPEYAKLTGHKTFSDLMLGYQFHWPQLVVKAFGGIASERHITDPGDPDAVIGDISYGGKVALEAWYSISPDYWIASDASWTSPLNTYKLGIRAGHKLLEDLDVGFEARLEGTEIYKAARAGAFATLRFNDVGLTFAGGVTGDYDSELTHYASVNVFVRY